MSVIFRSLGAEFVFKPVEFDPGVELEGLANLKTELKAPRPDADLSSVLRFNRHPNSVPSMQTLLSLIA
jgi:hypothetical protein